MGFDALAVEAQALVQVVHPVAQLALAAAAGRELPFLFFDGPAQRTQPLFTGFGVALGHQAVLLFLVEGGMSGGKRLLYLHPEMAVKRMYGLGDLPGQVLMFGGAPSLAFELLQAWADLVQEQVHPLEVLAGGRKAVARLIQTHPQQAHVGGLFQQPAALIRPHQ